MGAAYRYMSAWLYVMVIDAVNSGVSRRSGFCFSNRISCKHKRHSPAKRVSQGVRVCARVCVRVCARARASMRACACARRTCHHAPRWARSLAPPFGGHARCMSVRPFICLAVQPTPIGGAHPQVGARANR